MGATEKLRQVHPTISTQGKELVSVPKLKSSIRHLNENVLFNKGREEGLEDEVARTAAERTGIEALFDSVGAQVLVLREKLAAKDAAITSVFQALCATLVPSTINMVDNLRLGLSTSVGNAS